MLKKIWNNVVVLSLVLKHPRTPWYAKVIGILTISYAVSPIDLIPDFIPILGQLDDLIIVPLGAWLTFKLIPKDIIAECRMKAKNSHPEVKGVKWLAITIIIGAWLLLGLAVGSFILTHKHRNSIIQQ